MTSAPLILSSLRSFYHYQRPLVFVTVAGDESLHISQHPSHDFSCWLIPKLGGSDAGTELK
jgi:hypothetical protein